MCGRFTHLYSWRELHRLLDIHREPPVEQLRLSYNVAPTQRVPILRTAAAGDREVVFAKWGLVPSWADDPKIGSRMINARSETIAKSPAFRSAFKARRCVVPASGFYEWQAAAVGARKQPWYIFRADGDPLLFAGLWEGWDKGEAPLDTFTIATCGPNSFMAPMHDRMPVVLEPESVAAWLDPASSPSALAELMRPAADGELECHPVGQRVGNVANNDAELICEVED